MHPFLRAAKTRQNELNNIFYRLHRRPELSFQEAETTALIRAEIQKLGLCEIPLGMPTGLVALLEGGKPGPLVAIRADIDAIAETELSQSPAPSEVEGVMHACGHDLHTTCALGAAALLAEKRAELPGSVAFFFQPAEEVTQGAAAMLQSGLLQKLPKRPLGVFALHSAALPAGQVGLCPGAMAAGKTNFRIHLQGQSGQGGFPHEYADVIVAGLALAEGIQTIVSRNADPRKALVCALYSLRAGEHEFFVTDTMTLSGSVRALDEESLSMAETRLCELTQNIPPAYGCKGELELLPQVPVLINSPQLWPLAQKAALDIAGPQNALPAPPMLGSDDFAMFGRELPIFYYWLGMMAPGSGPTALHRPNFCVDPASAATGSALLAQAAFLALLQDAMNR